MPRRNAGPLGAYAPLSILMPHHTRTLPYSVSAVPIEFNGPPGSIAFQVPVATVMHASHYPARRQTIFMRRLLVCAFAFALNLPLVAADPPADRPVRKGIDPRLAPITD